MFDIDTINSVICFLSKMSMIDGVGDEVIQFVASLLVVSVAALAWWSTNARPNRYRTVILMRPRTPHPVTVSIRPLPSTSANMNTNSRDRESEVIPLQEMDSIVDADIAMMNNNRLHFYRWVNGDREDDLSQSSTDENPEGGEVASIAQITEMESIVNAMEADATVEANVQKPEMSTQTEARGTEDSDSGENATASQDASADTIPKETILIKLKYLNETHKEVEGTLDEQLKDFKWRHFSSELSSECRVRLIFNGHVLVDEAATLRACGLHDRAVVHCLVHPKRNNNQQRTSEEYPLNSLHDPIREVAAPERSWDLENILVTLVSGALTVIWFFRCEYSNMFTASASAALIGLTVFYSVAMMGLYLYDDQSSERRQPQPTNND